jgi:fimbrial chaperone protein
MGRHVGRVRSLLTVALLVALGFMLCEAQPVSASSVGVSPVHIYFTRSSPSALLTISNEGQESISFSLSAYAWSQGESGEIKLTPTSDIIFFPALLTLSPGEARNIRLGTELQPTNIEQTYRILLDELPPAQTGHPNPSMEVRVLSEISIPIFLVPDKPRLQADLSGISLHKNKLAFQLNNTGLVHILPSVTVAAIGSSGSLVYRVGPQQIWYVLAAGSRIVTVSLPAKPCAKVRELTISLELDSNTNSLTMTKSLPTIAGACAP